MFISHMYECSRGERRTLFRLTMFGNTKTELLDMFLDRSANESTNENRLITRETESGNVALIAYGWLKVAEYNEERNAVTVFTGHQSLRSTTVSRYLNDVAKRAESRGRDVVLSGESPTVDTPNEGTKFINNYISMSGDRSPVERDAARTVRQSLRHLA
jgi:hypothetical protein